MKLFKRPIQLLRRHILLGGGALGAALTCPAAAPNILLILADDVGYGDVPANYAGAQVPMPALGHLAAAGTRFLDAHSPASVCAPTRYSVLSGNYPWRGRRPYGTWNFNGGSQFRPGQWSLAMVLQLGGYHTAMFGKVHLGAHVHPAEKGQPFDESWNREAALFDFSQPLVGGPRDLGFTYSYTSPSGIQDRPYAYFENDRIVGDPEAIVHWDAGAYSNENGFSIIDKGKAGFGMPYWKSNEYAATLLDKARRFVDAHVAANKARGEKRPFFIHYCTEAVHVPHSPPVTFEGHPVSGATPSRHLDMLRALDLTVQALLDMLEEQGLLDNTLVIFTSDNGGLGLSDQLGHDASGGFRGNKGSVYEGGHRVPLIVHWPAGGIPAGATYPHLTGLQDLYRTLAEFADIAVPEEQALDSISFMQALLGRTEGPHRSQMLIQTVERSGNLAWREQGWKLILDATGQPQELYDLESDPFETDDLFDRPDLADRVQIMLRNFMALGAKELFREKN